MLTYVYSEFPDLASVDDFAITKRQAEKLGSYETMLKIMEQYCGNENNYTCIQSIKERLGFPSDINPPSPNQKIVVMSTPIFHSTSQYSGSQVYEKCEVSNCVNTYDKSYAKDARAFFFWCSNMPIEESEVPERRPDQLFLYACGESPLSLQTTRDKEDRRNVIMPFLNDKFNLTMGYKSSSLLVNTWYFNPFMSSYNGHENFYSLLNFDSKRKRLEQILPQKKNLVAWVASNCHSPSGREHFVRALQKHINVDIFGSGDCASNDKQISLSSSYADVLRTQAKKAFPRCPNDSRSHPDEKCVRSVLSEYKFYLSLENSICEDYITEKFFDVAFQNNAVPIIFGGSWYEKFVPRKDMPSFISASDFESPKDLARYLIYLDRNDEEYLKYFEWRKVPVSQLVKKLSFERCGPGKYVV